MFLVVVNNSFQSIGFFFSLFIYSGYRARPPGLEPPSSSLASACLLLVVSFSSPSPSTSACELSLIDSSSSFSSSCFRSLLAARQNILMCRFMLSMRSPTVLQQCGHEVPVFFSCTEARCRRRSRRVLKRRLQSGAALHRWRFRWQRLCWLFWVYEFRLVDDGIE
jgi:hypothetical protein